MLWKKWVKGKFKFVKKKKEKKKTDGESEGRQSKSEQKSSLYLSYEMSLLNNKDKTTYWIIDWQD